MAINIFLTAIGCPDMVYDNKGNISAIRIAFIFLSGININVANTPNLIGSSIYNGNGDK